MTTSRAGEWWMSLQHKASPQVMPREVERMELACAR